MEHEISPEKLDERIAKLEEEVRQYQVELAILRSQKLVELLAKMDGPLPRENRTVVRTPRGLSVKGSRLTLYSIMDGIRENNSLKNVRDLYELTDEEMLDVLDYIHLHKQEVEQEYREVLKSAEQNQKYWEDRNKEQLEKAYQQSETVRAKLQEWREQYRTDNKS